VNLEEVDFPRQEPLLGVEEAGLLVGAAEAVMALSTIDLSRRA
jgi:hypothetical protein